MALYNLRCAPAKILLPGPKINNMPSKSYVIPLFFCLQQILLFITNPIVFTTLLFIITLLFIKTMLFNTNPFVYYNPVVNYNPIVY